MNFLPNSNQRWSWSRPIAFLPDELSVVQSAFLPNISLLLLWECAPEPERLVSSTGDDRLAIRTHRQIQHSMCMPAQRGNHVQGRVLPYAYLVLGRRRREPVCRHEFMRSQGPRQVTNLDPVRTQTLNAKTVSGSLLTWLPVSNSLSNVPCGVFVFQNLMCLSCVPPPVARIPGT